MSDYDVENAFKRIEDELIASMIRNFDKHRAEEKKEGFKWTQWQAEQLKALNEYKRNNKEKFKDSFSDINENIEKAIINAKGKGGANQELKILEAMKNGFKPRLMPNINNSGVADVGEGFFKTNDRKLSSLIKATTDDMKNAETAVLRMSNDKYRKIIFDAQVYANTGAGTYKKAVDMATKDFLSAGINCVEYKNGRRVTVHSYAEMAVRTASKRAYLQGEGEKRKEWNITTVILNKRTNPCPLCAPFVGKVFIDDVWSGGSKDGISPVTGLKYPLLSEAIKQGLYHPNCRDAHTTYFEGISTPPKDSQYTADELDEIAEKYAINQKKKQAENQAERMERLSKYSLDPENQRIYGFRANNYRRIASSVDNLDFMSNSFRPKYIASTPINFRTSVGIRPIDVKKVENSAYNILTDSNATKRDKAVRITEKIMSSIQSKLPKEFQLPTIAVVDFDKNEINSNAIGGFDTETGILYINSKYNTRNKILDYLNENQGWFANTTIEAPFLHELGHKYFEERLKKLAKSQNISYNEAKRIVRKKMSQYLAEKGSDDFISKNLSGYAKYGEVTGKIQEIFAESFSVWGENQTAGEIMDMLK